MNNEIPKRMFCPGSEWLYCKLYSGPKTIERILIEEIYPLIVQLQKDKMIDGFFFIRYSDPDYHIRLRFHLCSLSCVYNVLNRLEAILDSYVEQLVINKIVIDTYKRELERYGYAEIEYVEKLFFIDSEFVLKYIQNCGDNESQKWMLSCKYIDALFDSLDMKIVDRVVFCKNRSEAFIMEIFKDFKFGKIQMGNKYREQKVALKSAIEEEGYKNSISPVVFAFYTNSIKETLLKMPKEHVFNILDSLIHMHINRMFRTRQRVVECVIYNLLWRYYVSKNAQI